MWMVPPELMCKKHLLGEHVECHMIAGSIQRADQPKHNKCIESLTRINCLQVSSLYERHQAITDELVSRGCRVSSELPQVNFSLLSDFVMGYKVDTNKSHQDLINRCEKCKNLNSLKNY